MGRAGGGVQGEEHGAPRGAEARDELAEEGGGRAHDQVRGARQGAAGPAGGPPVVSKHIDVVYHFARERVARKDVKIAYVKTNDMLADMLTKPVEKAKLDLCNRGIGMG